MKFKIINSIIQMLPFCNISISQGHYQDNFRFYMDEIPQQEELRKKWFEDNKYFLHKNRFGQLSIIFGCDTSAFIEACKKITQSIATMSQILNRDIYFEKRWMIRQ